MSVLPSAVSRSCLEEGKGEAIGKEDRGDGTTHGGYKELPRGKGARQVSRSATMLAIGSMSATRGCGCKGFRVWGRSRSEPEDKAGKEEEYTGPTFCGPDDSSMCRVGEHAALEDGEEEGDAGPTFCEPKDSQMGRGGGRGPGAAHEEFWEDVGSPPHEGHKEVGHKRLRSQSASTTSRSSRRKDGDRQDGDDSGGEEQEEGGAGEAVECHGGNGMPTPAEVRCECQCTCDIWDSCTSMTTCMICADEICIDCVKVATHGNMMLDCCHYHTLPDEFPPDPRDIDSDGDSREMVEVVEEGSESGSSSEGTPFGHEERVAPETPQTEDDPDKAYWDQVLEQHGGKGEEDAAIRPEGNQKCVCPKDACKGAAGREAVVEGEIPGGDARGSQKRGRAEGDPDAGKKKNFDGWKNSDGRDDEDEPGSSRPKKADEGDKAKGLLQACECTWCQCEEVVSNSQYCPICRIWVCLGCWTIDLRDIDRAADEVRRIQTKDRRQEFIGRTGAPVGFCHRHHLHSIEFGLGPPEEDSGLSSEGDGGELQDDDQGEDGAASLGQEHLEIDRNAGPCDAGTEGSRST
jgi:hypothetical protein